MTNSASQTIAFNPSGPALERALDRSCGRAIPGNQLRYLTDGPEAFGVMADVIEDAQRFAHFENYIINDDRTGKRFADLLKAAAGRGVAVRVLYDQFGSRWTPRRYWNGLRRAGVEVRAFRPINPLRPLHSARRDHRKYVGADGRRAVVGGLCIGDAWNGDPARQRLPWRDTALEVCGPAAAAIGLTFERQWRLAGGKVDTPEDAYRADPCGAAAVRAVDGLPGKLRVYGAISLLVASASARVWITEAYLMAPTPLVASLIGAARDGVDVRLLLPGKSDIPALRAFTRVGYRELLDSGARIWEWRGPMLHAKTVIVDHAWVKVGSSNLNASSLFNNYELDLLVTDPALADQAANQFRRDLTFATEIILRAPRLPSPLAQRLPPAVVSAAPFRPVAHHAVGRLERSRRAVVALRQVAAGARRSIAGAVIFGSLGTGILFVLAPRVMGYLVALGCFATAANAARHFLARRQQRDD